MWFCILPTDARDADKLAQTFPELEQRLQVRKGTTQIQHVVTGTKSTFMERSWNLGNWK